jgi:hypothetical protein
VLPLYNSKGFQEIETLFYFGYLYTNVLLFSIQTPEGHLFKFAPFILANAIYQIRQLQALSTILQKRIEKRMQGFGN